jgi:N-acetylglucosamine-6-phosphate deacetylase
MRTLLAGADLVLPDRVAANHTLVIEHGRIAEVSGSLRTVTAGERRIDLSGHIIVPGFIDVHVHGVAGRDVQDGAPSTRPARSGQGAIAAIAATLPRYGVTAFCPTTVACSAADLSVVLDEVRALRAAANPRAARVLPAHLESNFINQNFAGAQPIECLRMPPIIRPSHVRRPTSSVPDGTLDAGRWTTDDDVLLTIQAALPDVGIMTVAPELAGGIDFVRAHHAAGIIVSIGHSGADYEASLAAIAAGARQATHLFNRMTPLTSREPGMVGAVLASDEVCAELICDGRHVHPASMRVAIASKSASRIMAITDGTAGSGLPRGTQAMLGGRRITVEDVARLDDGTIAGSVLTMDRAFACLVGQAGAGLVDGARMCSTTPARELGLQGHGVLASGAVADLVVLDANLNVRQTWIGGEPVFDELSRRP